MSEYLTLNGLYSSRNGLHISICEFVILRAEIIRFLQSLMDSIEYWIK